MRIPRALLWSVAAVVVLAAGALWWVYASRDALLKAAIERFGPELTGVSVEVASVRLQPLDGRGSIRGLEIGNPKGFKAPHALSLGEMRLAVEPSTIASSVVHVKEISLEAPSITYEQGPDGDNLSAIERHIESYLPRPAAAKGGKAENAAQERRFVVDRLEVRKARVSYGGALAVELPDLQMRDLGGKSGGASAAEITREVWGAVTRQVAAAAPGALRGLEDKAKGAMDKLRGLFK